MHCKGKGKNVPKLDARTVIRIEMRAKGRTYNGSSLFYARDNSCARGDFPHVHVGKLLKKSVKKVSQIVDFSFAL